MNAPRFHVREMPGEIGDVRLSLAGRFAQIGFLEPAPSNAPPRESGDTTRAEGAVPPRAGSAR